MLLTFPCRLRHLHDTFGVNLVGYRDLRYTTRGWRNAEEFKLAKEIVVLSKQMFTLEDLDEHRGLIVRSRFEISVWDCRCYDGR